MRAKKKWSVWNWLRGSQLKSCLYNTTELFSSKFPTEKLKLKRLRFYGGLDCRFGDIVLLVLFSEMESAVLVLPLNYANPNELYSRGHKRIKTSSDAQNCSSASSSVGMKDESKEMKSNVSQNVMDYSNPFAIQDMLDRLDSERFGSVTDEIKALINNKMQILGPHIARNISKLPSQKAFCDVIDIDDDCLAVDGPSKPLTVVVLSDDEEEEPDRKPFFPFQEVVLMQPPAGQSLSRDIEIRGYKEKIRMEGTGSAAGEVDVEKDEGVYVGVEENDDDQTNINDDGLGDIWQELSMALECSKDVDDNLSDEHVEEDDEDCEHSFLLKDDLGYVCRICGVIERRIETIIDVQFNKAKKSTRTYASDYRSGKDRDSSDMVGVKLSEDDLVVTDIAAHPRHKKQMKPHQVEGFNFLRSNLVTDNPGGCILAHAPGSGKTFMIISFMQSFLAKYPHARPLVILPKGILGTWKREFQTWQVEDLPLLDFYTVKADSRAQQLEVLKKWVEQKSILFLGYKQFSSIVCDKESSQVSATCQEILLKQPSILILDEGHTPRNEDTDVLQSLSKVQTPRKVVLSGTLYQNHVKEVFNILNLVRPKFLKSDTSRPLVKRIMSRVHIPGVRKNLSSGTYAAFYELVEHTLLKDEDFKRKVTVIQDLREMTNKVLHYYKGDFLDELPGLVDFTVLLNPTPKQKIEGQKLKKFSRKFKICAAGSAVFLHPMLSSLSENSVPTDIRWMSC
ncbi:hypothetical protein Dsin_026729 [Dipteronia sinensis]|uniref:Helicase ATP-binding domain-containing protein n=1 Tax=Dipteronia sinensis TaxID=43782 RepID=A0AAD9ZZ92_9ROSI|nr:hypothetical protein Dsin_026729 [Dipteronia sinensis]